MFNLEEIILQNGFYVIGKNSSYLGVDYSILACTKPQIDIYNGCQYAAFTEVGECIAIGSESGDSGMASQGGWTWIKDKLDNRYIKTVYPPRNEITVKLGIAESVVLIGGQWGEYSQEKTTQEKLKNPWKPALYQCIVTALWEPYRDFIDYYLSGLPFGSFDSED